MASVPNHFYVILFSDASQALFPDNTVNAFTSELARVISWTELDSLSTCWSCISSSAHFTQFCTSLRFELLKKLATQHFVPTTSCVRQQLCMSLYNLTSEICRIPHILTSETQMWSVLSWSRYLVNRPVSSFETAVNIKATDSSLSSTSSKTVFLNSRVAARYRALAPIIPGREKFSWDLSF